LLLKKFQGNIMKHWIDQLGLQSHPEGGYFREVYRCPEEREGRALATSIYFMLENNDVSALHQIDADELWYFHGGSSFIIHCIDGEGDYQTKKLGMNLEEGESPQLIIPAGTIFGAELIDKNSAGLCACMVAPGFEFTKFKLFTKGELLSKFPRHAAVIKTLNK